jgi:hypothetical protein
MIVAEFRKHMKVEPTGILEITEKAWMGDLYKVDEPGNVLVEECATQKARFGFGPETAVYELRRKVWHSKEVSRLPGTVKQQLT